ncbi:MAG TPA: Hsp20/alpha crystallin family protein [Burkholderiales bacterium]|nr:Hsp20/alpha crystallin family protein [Burkholderiales bacterium]
MAEAGKEVTVKKGEIQKAPSRMLSPFEGFDRMFDEFLGRGWMRPFRRDWLAFPEFEITMPKVDVIDRDEEVVVRAEVPSVKKEDIEISISGNLVTIKGETKKEEKEEKGDYYRAEISRGSFSRMVSLPADVDESKAKAALKDGVLELTLPKIEKAKRRTIKVD